MPTYGELTPYFSVITPYYGVITPYVTALYHPYFTAL